MSSLVGGQARVLQRYKSPAAALGSGSMESLAHLCPGPRSGGVLLPQGQGPFQLRVPAALGRDAVPKEFRDRQRAAMECMIWELSGVILLHGRQAMPGSLLDYQELLLPLQPLASCARVPDVPHWSPCWGQGLVVPALWPLCMSLS